MTNIIARHEVIRNLYPIDTWLDGNTPDLSKFEWPTTGSGRIAHLSRMTDSGVVMACKSDKGTIFVGPDKHKQTFRIKHNKKLWPLFPQLLLYSGPSDASPIWAMYESTSYQEARVEMPCRSTASSSPGHVKVHRMLDGKKNNYVFTMTIQGREETFGWRRSRNVMIKDLGLSHKGYKLVRLTELSGTGSGTQHFSSSLVPGPKTSDRLQIVACCARSHFRIHRFVAFKYLASFGDEWEVVALVTLLAFWIWDRKHYLGSQ